MVKLLVCEICGEAYIGLTTPSNCPFCGVKGKFMKPFNEVSIQFDVELTEKDKPNAETALKLELSNASFYFCAAAITDDAEGKKMFKILGKVEQEHASVWQKILKLEEVDKLVETCTQNNQDNLKESNTRETAAIKFYQKAAEESDNDVIKKIFEAFVDVEKDHLALTEERII